MNTGQTPRYDGRGFAGSTVDDSEVDNRSVSVEIKLPNGLDSFAIMGQHNLNPAWIRENFSVDPLFSLIRSRYFYPR